MFFYSGLQKELTVKMFGLALMVQFLRLGGRSCSEYLNDDLMRLWISGGLSGTKLIKSCPLKVCSSCFIILPMHMVWSLRSKSLNPQLKAERLTGAAKKVSSFRWISSFRWALKTNPLGWRKDAISLLCVITGHKWWKHSGQSHTS